MSYVNEIFTQPEWCSLHRHIQYVISKCDLRVFSLLMAHAVPPVETKALSGENSLCTSEDSMCHHVTLSHPFHSSQVFRTTPGCVTVGFPPCLTLVKPQNHLWSCWIGSWPVVNRQISLEFPFRVWSSLAAAGPTRWPLPQRSQLYWVAMFYFAVMQQDSRLQQLCG